MSPMNQNKILRLNFCQWTDSASAWITREMWESVEDPTLNWDKMRGRRCFTADDLSFTTDMSARAFVFPDDEGGYDVLVKFWRPEEGLKEAVDRDKVRYDVWAKNGDIDLTPGKVIKLPPIAANMGEAMDFFEVESSAYDKYRHKELADLMADLGVIPPLIEHPQGFRRGQVQNPNSPTQKIDNPLWMPSSCQELHNAIIEGRLRVQVNACLRWNVSSAVVRENPAGTDDWIFDKRRATGRIDGLVAVAMAVGAAKYVGGWQPPVSPWEDPTFKFERA